VKNSDFAIASVTNLLGRDVPRPIASDHARAFDAVYTEHVGGTYRFLLGLTRDRAEAEDLTADVFERAYRAWVQGSFPSDRAAEWPLRTGRNLAIDRWRRARRLAAILLKSPQPSRPKDQDRAEFLIWLDDLSRVLSPRQQAFLLLRYRNDLSDDAIGVILGTSASGVRSLASRTLATLRDHQELL